MRKARRPRIVVVQEPERFLGESELDYRSRRFVLREMARFKAHDPSPMDAYDAGWRIDVRKDYWDNLRALAQVYDALAAQERASRAAALHTSR